MTVYPATMDQTPPPNVRVEYRVLFPESAMWFLVGAFSGIALTAAFFIAGAS